MHEYFDFNSNSFAYILKAGLDLRFLADRRSGVVKRHMPFQGASWEERTALVCMSTNRYYQIRFC